MIEQYYHAIDGKRAGPVSPSQLQELATKGELKRGDKVWCRGMKEWQPAESVAKLFDELPPDLETELPQEMPPPLPVEGSSALPATQNLWAMQAEKPANPAAAEFMKKERQIYVVGYPIGAVFAILAAYFGRDASTAESSSILPSVVCLLLGVGALILAYLNWMKVHYRLWNLIPPVFAATSPAKAIGFYFIPLFNIYWCFVTFNALAANANKTLAGLREPTVKCNEGLALGFSITQAVLLSGVLGFIPVLALLALVASYILWILWYADLAKALSIIEKHAVLKGQPATVNLHPVPA